MSELGAAHVERFGLLASFLAGRTMSVVEQASERAYTDGRTVFLPKGSTHAEQRRALLVQGALLGAGSLTPRLVGSLRARPRLARRYLSLEGTRALSGLAAQGVLAAQLDDVAPVTTASAEESLAQARSRRNVPEPPPWFGELRPSLLLRTPDGTPPGSARSYAREPARSAREAEQDALAEGPGSRILRLFDNPAFGAGALAELLARVFGSARAKGDATAGGELPTLQRARAGAHGRPASVPLRVAAQGTRSVHALTAIGALYPEWDRHNRRYRPAWARVIEATVVAAPDLGGASAERDELLRRRLARVCLGYQALRRRLDGDELDLDAAVDVLVALRSGAEPSERVFVERRKQARELAVLVLVDASGSTHEGEALAGSAHEQQCRAAATLAATLEELGDRVAVYGFRSHGRLAVHMLPVKTFAQRFGAGARARLGQLRPEGYTRLGAAVRHAAQILSRDGGARNRLLLVISDGIPYDDGYEAGYAEADARRALEELRADGLACLCLSLGAATSGEALRRVFGASQHASAASLRALSPRMDQLFLAALRELARASRGEARRVPKATR